MPPIIALVILSCLATTDFSGFDPHQLGAAEQFVGLHPESCGASPPVIVDEPTLEQCQGQSFLHVLPQWQTLHPDSVYLGNACFEHKRNELQAYLHAQVH